MHGRHARQDSFFRTHPDASYYLHLHVLVYDGEGKRRSYLLDPALLGLPELEGLCKICRVVPYITHHGAIGIWLISISMTTTHGFARR